VRGLTIKGCALLLARATALAIARTTLEFMVSLKSPYPSPNLKEWQPPLELIYHMSQVLMDVGCNRTLSKPPSIKEKYCSHLPRTNTMDKQF